jgi:hypothetical protein
MTIVTVYRISDKKIAGRREFESAHSVLATIKDFNATVHLLRSLSSLREGHGVSSTNGCSFIGQVLAFQICLGPAKLKLPYILKKSS